MNSFLVIIAFSVLSFQARADFSLDQISDAQLEGIIQDFGANFVHTSVSPASSLGDILGFELGVVLGAATSPEIEKISKQIDANADAVETLPNAGFLGVVSGPLGFTGEIIILPTFEGDDAEISNTSFAIKWTFTQLFPLPVDMSVKAFSGTSEAEFTQDDPAPDTKVKYETITSGLMFQVSKKLAIIEPYAGIGYVTSDGELSASNSIFADATLKKKADVSGTMLSAGLNLNLLVFKLGAEVSKIYESEKAMLKASFYF